MARSRVKRRADGKWRARYVGPDGKEHAAHRATKAAAQAWLNEQTMKMATGSWVDPSSARLTVRDAAERWLTSNPRKRPTTRAADESQLRTHIYPTFGARRIGSVTRADVQALVNAWRETMQPRSVRRCFGVLRAVFTFALESDWIGKNPCRGVKLPEVNGSRARWLAPQEIVVLADVMPAGYRLMIWFGAMCGLRWGEVAALRVGRVDVLRATVTIAEGITRDAKGASRFGPPKSQAGIRTLTMPPQLVRLVAAHLTLRGLTGADADELLFVSDAGGPLDYANWRRRVWLPAVRAAGVEGAGFHDLRRANATALVASNVDLKTAQTRLGHSDSRLTIGLYAQATTEGDRRAADALGEWFAIPADFSRTGTGSADGSAGA